MDKKINHGEYVKNLILDISEKFENRLPCSSEEKDASQALSDQIRNETEVLPIVETFKANPLSYIGIMPIIGYMGYFAVLCFYLTPVLSFIISIAILLLSLTHLVFSKGTFDFLFKKHTSQNVLAYIEPTENAEKTIILSSHIDSSWGKPLCFINTKTVTIKMVISIISLVSIFLISLIAICNGALDFTFWTTGIINSKEGIIQNFGYLIMFIMPAFSIPGLYWFTQYISLDKKQAPNGILDNLTGCELAISVFKHLNENKDALPKNVRVILALFGANKAGRKGSKYFIKKHKNEFTKDIININLDTFYNESYTIIKNDAPISGHFDNYLIDKCLFSMKDMGIEPIIKSQFFEGCDSSSFNQAKIKTITLCAKNMSLDNYTHTINDSIHLVDEQSLQTGFNIVNKIIDSLLTESNN